MKIEARDLPVLGILWVIYACLCVIAVAAMLVYSDRLTQMWGALLMRVAEPQRVFLRAEIGNNSPVEDWTLS